LTWQEVVRIGQQVAAAMLYAVETVQREPGSEADEPGGFAHRDLHGGNIMIVETPNGLQAKVLDFDLARVPIGIASTADFEAVDKRLKFRAPGYGRRSDFRDDMFALGVILYNLICGEDPYDRRLYHAYVCVQLTPEEATEVVPIPVRRYPTAPPDLPEQLETILLRMVALRPQDRYESWQLLYDVLDHLAPIVAVPA
jgi:serine/threonine-protein kinase